MPKARKIIIGILILIVVVAAVTYWYIAKENANRKDAPPLIQRLFPTNTTEAPKDAPLIETVATGFEVPWALAFLPDNSLLVTERPGRVRLITSEGAMLPEPLLTLSVVQKIQGEGGLHGIAPHPDFAMNSYVYLYYTYESNGSQSLNRVARYTLANNKLINEKIIVDQIPGALFHDGGRIKFGPDKFLYITTGDAQEPSLAQNKDALAGKILRVTDDGSPAPSNPFSTRIYSFGHRNPQGIAWDENNTLWQTEHGRSNPTGYDEVNLIEPGKNYGWPTIEGDKNQTGMEIPKSNSGPTTTWAPGGAAFVKNSLFFVGLKGQTLYEAITTNNQVTELKEHFKGEYGRLRDVITGPDGMLYVTTSNRDGRGVASSDDDKIFRINPQKL